MSEAESYFLGFQSRFLWTVLVSTIGYDIYPRVVGLQYSKDLGLFIFSKSTTEKMAQIENNPQVTLILAPTEENDPVIAYCTARISDNKEEIDSVYTDDLKKVGYSGRDDPRIRLIIFTINSVEHGPKHFEGVKSESSSSSSKSTETESSSASSSSSLYQEKEGNDAIVEAISESPNAHLITWKEGKITDRMMRTLYNPELGVYHITSTGTRKLKQMQENSHAVILFEQRKSMKQTVVRGNAIINVDDEIRSKGWIEEFGGFYVGGIKNKNWVVITYNIDSVTVHDMKNISPTVYKYDNTKQTESEKKKEEL